MIKKIIALLITAALMTAFCGCDSADDNTEKADEAANTEAVAEVSADSEIVEETEEQTEAAAVKTEKVTVYKEICNIDFSVMADGSAPFSNNAVPDLRVEDGVLKGTSTSGDPYCVYAGDFLLNADEVDTIVVKLKSYSDSYNFQFFFTTPDVSWSEGASYHATLENGGSANIDNDWNYVTIDTSDCSYWVNQITCFRIDPFSAEGEFEIAYVAFYQCTELEVPVE